MSTKVEKVKDLEEDVLHTFQIETSLYENKERKMKFNTYIGFIGKGLKRITVKFTRDVKDTPTESGMITVKASDMSVDTRSKYPTLWLRGFEKLEQLDANRSNASVNKLFGVDKDEEDLPF